MGGMPRRRMCKTMSCSVLRAGNKSSPVASSYSKQPTDHKLTPRLNEGARRRKAAHSMAGVVHESMPIATSGARYNRVCA